MFTIYRGGLAAYPFFSTLIVCFPAVRGTALGVVSSVVTPSITMYAHPGLQATFTGARNQHFRPSATPGFTSRTSDFVIPPFRNTTLLVPGRTMTLCPSFAFVNGPSSTLTSPSGTASSVISTSAACTVAGTDGFSSSFFVSVAMGGGFDFSAVSVPAGCLTIPFGSLRERRNGCPPVTVTDVSTRVLPQIAITFRFPAGTATSRTGVFTGASSMYTLPLSGMISTVSFPSSGNTYGRATK